MPAIISRYSALKRVFIYPLPRLAEDFQQAHAQLFQRCISTSPSLVAAPASVANTNVNEFIGPRIAISGFGIAARINTVGADGFERAGALWQELCAQAQVHGDSAATSIAAEVPQFPLALGSFGFAASAHGTLIVPARGLVTTEDNASFAFSWDEPWEPVFSSEVAATTVDSPLLGSLPQLRSLQPGALTESEWMEAVADVIAKLRDGQARKVVLARDVIADFDDVIPALTLLQRLSVEYPTCWRFLIDGLIGATPELIARLDRTGVMQCRVLAGTAPRGQEVQLAASLKDQREHAIARDSVLERLTPLATEVRYSDEPFVLELPNVCHLATDISAQLPAQVTSLDVAAALHPTAAVCGLPRAQAAAIIAAHEQLNRGRYAAPVGWMDSSGAGEWALALRLGQLDPADARRIQLIAGAGIMPDSVPSAELRETQMKLQPLLRALGIAEVATSGNPRE